MNPCDSYAHSYLQHRPELFCDKILSIWVEIGWFEHIISIVMRISHPDYIIVISPESCDFLHDRVGTIQMKDIFVGILEL